jgi:hypothetical protein
MGASTPDALEKAERVNDSGFYRWGKGLIAGLERKGELTNLIRAGPSLN